MNGTMSYELPGAPPEIRFGITGSIALHVILVVLLFVVRPSPPPARPLAFKVTLVAAPQGTPQVGVVQAPPKTQPEAPAPKVSEAPIKTTRPVETKTKTVQQPKRATANVPTPATTPPPKTAAPTAGSAVGGRGTDVDNVNVGDIDFPYPGYLNNIVNQIRQRFPPQSGTFEAHVAFKIQRDGSVDLNDIKILKHSQSYLFNQQARDAIEQAARAMVFGALPAGYQEDALFVMFIFDPKIR